MVSNRETLSEEASRLAEQLFEHNGKKRSSFISQLLEMCERAEGKDILLIHNPGGWGSTQMENLLQWERSIVEGIGATLGKLGYKCSTVQYFRTGHGWHAIMGDIREQTRFFTSKAKIMAAELEFVVRHYNNLRVVMIGVSQGAAFSNAVTQRLNGLDRVYSIELGIPFPYKSKRVMTERTLALDSNGLMPDALMEWNVPIITRTYFSAPFRWVKHRLHGEKVKFTYCINLPGHDYNWDYPEVQRQIEDFLKTKFGVKRKSEVKRK
ncbi:MAG: hypothetical protein HYX80_02615 [Chloroflexi bacterium]|nr:hypothetical protein [Chloroflexota bacterium]